MDEQILSAIAGRNIITFMYGGRSRTCEPHVFGLANGLKQVLCWQGGGSSSRGKLPNWRRFDLNSISQLEVTKDTFPGARPIPSGAHSIWDKVIATV